MIEPDVSDKAVQARIRLLREDYAADGAGFDANLLEALLARAQKAEALLGPEYKVYEDCSTIYSTEFGTPI